MADVYVVYASENVELAERLVELLSQQWKDVWWDKKIVGKFRKAIEQKLPLSGCVIAINSARARDKDTYAEELRLADKYNIEILPIRLDDAELPYPFGVYSHIDMQGWAGEETHRGFIELKSKLALVVPPKERPKRPVAIAGGKVLLPNLFMSVSSFETQLTPLEAVRALRIFKSPTILVSAYDLVKRNRKIPHELISEIVKYKESGGFVLIDSGNYEKARLASKRWGPDKLKEVFANVPHDWAFCFDIMKPSDNHEVAIDEIIEAVSRDNAFTTSSVLPVIHAPKLKPVGHQLEHIPIVIKTISERLKPPLIAIPERELGAGLVARAKMVQRIRYELNSLPYYQPLHILGTGNPWSIAILTAAGADTFDGLEWCRMAVDRSKNKLHHFQHYDFFKYQTKYADYEVTRDACNDDNIDFAGKVAFHNLDYFADFMNLLRKYTEDKMESFLLRIIDVETTDQLKKEIPRIFK